MAAASTGHVQSFFKLNFRCIENKYTFNTIREAKEEDTVGNLINTVLDTDSIDCMMIDHVVSGLTEDSATFQTSLNTPIEVLKQFNRKGMRDQMQKILLMLSKS